MANIRTAHFEMTTTTTMATKAKPTQKQQTRSLPKKRNRTGASFQGIVFPSFSLSLWNGKIGVKTRRKKVLMKGLAKVNGELFFGISFG